MAEAALASLARGRGRSLRPWPLGAGLAVLVVALAPPLEERVGSDLLVHMVQHVVLLSVVPPLLVLGLRRGAATSTWLATALVAHTALLWGWHIPTLYEAAVDHAGLHVVEHLSLLGAGWLLWWALGLGADQVGSGGILTLFLAALAGTGLGVALTFASNPWYAGYPSLADQQMAGVVMWGFGGAIYAVAAAGLVVLWLREEEP